MHLNTSPSPWVLNPGLQALAARMASLANSGGLNVIGCFA